jgi:TM2 domain-containing membrane protein YozV
MSSEFDGRTMPPPVPPLPPPVSLNMPPKSPGLALVLSVLPGLGQVYNGQPAKAMVFFFGFVGAIYGTAQISPFPFAFLIPFVYFYGMIDAYKSAVQINAKAAGGTLVDEDTAESPAWGWSLIGLGALLLAHTLGWLNFIAFERYWPVLLIAGGIGVLLKSRVKR